MKRDNLRKGAKRRRTGCTRCRASHNKCDEIRPRCGRCERLSLECETSDFIVPSSWSSSTPGTAVSDEGCSRPTSTWDVFNNSTTPLPNLELPRPQRSHSTTPSIDSEKVNLIQEYQSGVGTWVGLFDDDLNIERTVVKRALECPMLMNAICALTARQISRVGQGEIWESTAVRYYGESLHQLIKMLQDQSYCPEDALAATVLLSSYELLFFPGLDHRRHVSGALSLIRTHACKASSMGVMGAAFWVYARQDVAISLVHERSTMHPPEEWGVSWAQQETAEDRLGNKIIWIVAKVITFTFKTVEEPYAQSLSYDKTSLTNELDAWFESLPASFCGTPFGEPSQEGFIKRVFVVPSTAGAMCMYHLARLVLLTEGRNTSFSAGDNSRLEINEHARSIASIGLSPISDGSLVQAAQPLYYAGKHIDSHSGKFKIWALLNRIESDLGFHTGNRMEQLQQQMKSD